MSCSGSEITNLKRLKKRAHECSATVTGLAFLMSNQFKFILNFTMHCLSFWMVLSISYHVIVCTDKLITNFLENHFLLFVVPRF